MNEAQAAAQVAKELRHEAAHQVSSVQAREIIAMIAVSWERYVQLLEDKESNDG